MFHLFFLMSNISYCSFVNCNTSNICQLYYLFHSKLVSKFLTQIKIFPKVFGIFYATLLKCFLLGTPLGGFWWAQVNGSTVYKQLLKCQQPLSLNEQRPPQSRDQVQGLGVVPAADRTTHGATWHAPGTCNPIRASGEVIFLTVFNSNTDHTAAPVLHPAPRFWVTARYKEYNLQNKSLSSISGVKEDFQMILTPNITCELMKACTWHSSRPEEGVVDCIWAQRRARGSLQNKWCFRKSKSSKAANSFYEASCL